MSLWLQPPRGTQDRFPEEFAIRKHIFDTWRKVCTRFCYEEYLWPLVEQADIWRAKSGEDVGWTELTLITDREWNISDLALRPEMTPSVTRMVASRYRALSKPIRWFSIANFYRNERPQRGRNREFRQLNVDMFGETNDFAELEILQMALELMLAFNAPKWSFVLKINHRYLIDHFLLDVVHISHEQKTPLIRVMDKWEKLSREEFVEAMKEQGIMNNQRDAVMSFLSSTSLAELIEYFPTLEDNASIVQINSLMYQLNTLGYGERITFSPSLMRGFDYYDGIVFEVFDMHPDNNRAMFGGWRYNGLASIYWSKEQIPAIGFAPGDEPMRLFLESRWLAETIKKYSTREKYLIHWVPVWPDEWWIVAHKIAHDLRTHDSSVEVVLESKSPGKMIEIANKKGYTHVIFVLTNEIEKGVYKVKNLQTGEEIEKHFNHIVGW